MENVEQLYSYGDMPPWGKGPVQGKIHGHPEYIEENFPNMDKFVHCKVERLNIEQEGNIVYKKDRVTDEEEFAEARELQVPNESSGDVMNSVGSAYKAHEKDQIALPADWQSFNSYAGVGVIVMMMIALLLLNRRKKEEGKSH